MKRAFAVWIVCSVLSIASFGLLVYGDRRLGVATPYSLPLAFGVMAVLAPAMFALYESLRAKRPIVVRTPVVEVAKPSPVSAPAPAEPDRRYVPVTRRRAKEGVVLLDWASVAASRRERAA